MEVGASVFVVDSHPGIRTAAGERVVVQDTPQAPEDIQGHLVGMVHHIHEVQEVEVQVEVHLEEDMARVPGKPADCEEEEARYTGPPARVGNNPVEGVDIGLRAQER